MATGVLDPIKVCEFLKSISRATVGFDLKVAQLRKLCNGPGDGDGPNLWSWMTCCDGDVYIYIYIICICIYDDWRHEDFG